MEVVLYGALSTIWWMSSMSVLLPFLLLLKYSKPCRNRWFSFIFTRVCGPFINKKLIPMRECAFELLKENLKRDSTSQPLEVLEIGIGSGANLPYYPENSNLTALDMNETFESYFKETQKKHPHVTYKRTVIGMAEDMNKISDSCMDLVICTYVLCSVESMDAVLSEVKRVLKPGGKFLFLEHVAYPASEWGFTLQGYVAPLWHLYFDGCYPNRHIANKIYQTGFANVICEDKRPDGLMMFIRPQIIGIATK